MISTAGVGSEHVAVPPTPDSADAHEQPRSVGRRGSRIEHTVELASARELAKLPGAGSCEATLTIA